MHRQREKCSELSRMHATGHRLAPHQRQHVASSGIAHTSFTQHAQYKRSSKRSAGAFVVLECDAIGIRLQTAEPCVSVGLIAFCERSECAHSCNDFEGCVMKKTVVEDCLVLDVNKLNENRIFTKTQRWVGSVEWKNSSSIGISNTGHGVSFVDSSITLDYRHKDENVSYDIRIASTSCYFGGRRFWFVCPGQSQDSSACARRVGMLYKPYHSRYFLCRHCHVLSYRSRQEWKSQSEIGVLLQALELQSELEMWAPSRRMSLRLEKKAEKLFTLARRKGLIQ